MSVRKRIKKGTLVASTNKIVHILSKRLIVEITYESLSYKIVSDKVIGTRQFITQ